MTLRVNLLSNWSFVLNYTYKTSQKTDYSLDSISLTYRLDPEFFHDAADLNQKKFANASNLNLFPARKDDSYRCISLTPVRVSEVGVNFREYQAEPFMDEKSKGFNTGML